VSGTSTGWSGPRRSPREPAGSTGVRGRAGREGRRPVGRRSRRATRRSFVRFLLVTRGPGVAWASRAGAVPLLIFFTEVQSCDLGCSWVDRRTGRGAARCRSPDAPDRQSEGDRPHHQSCFLTGHLEDSLQSLWPELNKTGSFTTTPLPPWWTPLPWQCHGHSQPDLGSLVLVVDKLRERGRRTSLTNSAVLFNSRRTGMIPRSLGPDILSMGSEFHGAVRRAFRQRLRELHPAVGRKCLLPSAQAAIGGRSSATQERQWRSRRKPSPDLWLFRGAAMTGMSSVLASAVVLP
jgi:hypothetical protein